MKKNAYIYLIVVLGFFGCQNSNNSQTPDSDQASEGTSKGISCNCLENYNGDATFFDADFASEFANGETVKIEKAGSKKHIYYTAMWDDGDNTAFLSLDSFSTLAELQESYPYVFGKKKDLSLVDYVKKTYRNQSDEETAKHAALLDEQYEKQNKNNSLNEVNAKAKNSLQNTLLDMEQNAYGEIEGLADYAVYNSKSKKLYVVCGNVFFEISGQVGPWNSQDVVKGKELALMGAKKIINTCS
ncbi:MAG: hypothetical protein H0X63_01640 [Flavobacteriales bacterium]|jgi:hypothetical protein|nr:hypothetical protein [Flavobacteriales bacterium]